MKIIKIIVICLTFSFFSISAFAHETITQVACNSWGAVYELVQNDNGAFLRTKLSTHIKRHNNNRLIGRRTAVLRLQRQLLAMVKKQESLTKGTYRVSGHIRTKVYYTNSYAIIKIGDAEIDHKKVNIN